MPPLFVRLGQRGVILAKLTRVGVDASRVTRKKLRTPTRICVWRNAFDDYTYGDSQIGKLSSGPRHRSTCRGRPPR